MPFRQFREGGLSRRRDSEQKISVFSSLTLTEYNLYKNLNKYVEQEERYIFVVYAIYVLVLFFKYF